MRQLATAPTGPAAVVSLGVAAAPEASATTSGTTTTTTRTLTMRKHHLHSCQKSAAADATAAARYTDGTNVFVAAIGNIIGNAGEPATSCILNPGTPDQFGPSAVRHYTRGMKPRLIYHRA